jgi:hypothetical protein
MKRFFSAIISTAIAVSMLLSMAVSATATNEATDSRAIGISETVVIPGNDELSQKEYTISTEFENIKESDDGFYAMEVASGNDIALVPVGRLDIDVVDENVFSATMQRTDISEQAKEEITANREKMIELGSLDGYEVTVFSQFLLPEDSRTVVYSMRKKGINRSYGTVVPFGTTYTYETYSGIPMVIEDVVQTGLNTTYKTVASGISAKSTAETAITIALTIVGFSSSTLINYVATGISLLSYFLTTVGTSTFTASYTDTLQVRLIYDKTTRSAFLIDSNDIWHIGVTTRKVTVTKIGSEQYYYNGGNNGKTLSLDRTVSQTIKGSYFDSPYSEAYFRAANNYTPANEQLQWKATDATFIF